MTAVPFDPPQPIQVTPYPMSGGSAPYPYMPTSVVNNQNHNYNHDEPRVPYTDEELRSIALREAISYFSYVQSRGALGAAEPVGALTVLGMADHFADYIRTGAKPEKPE